MPHHTHLTRRAGAAALALAGAAALAPAAHAAPTWTQVASGTTETITALDYRADKTVYGTANGKIFLSGTQRASYPGYSVIDLKMSPNGTNGIAALSSGRVARTTDGGTTWSALTQLQTYSPTHDCNYTPAVMGPIAADTAAVGWKDNSTAYVTTQVNGSVLRTTNAGASYAEISRQPDGSCRVTPGSGYPVTDVAPIQGSDAVYFIDKYFGGVSFSSDGLASTASARGDVVNCYDKKPQLAVDTATNNHLAFADGCSDNLSMVYSEDGGTTYRRLDTVNDIQTAGLSDVSFVNGTILWVGKAGDIFMSTNGRTAYRVPVTGGDATRDWDAVSAYSESAAAVGGTGGALYVTSSANSVPDVIAPSGTINDPGTVTAGRAVQLTANLVDNTGGTGIDPASIRWSATGIPDATGNPATVTFPSSGYYTVTVSFKDLAGNAASVSRGIFVDTATTTIPGSTPGGTSTGSIAGATFTLQGPTQCVPAGSTFVATMSMRRLAIKNNRIVKLKRVDFFIDGKLAKKDTKAPFKQTLAVSGLAAGSLHSLKAVGYVKVKRGKAPKRTQTVKFGVCG